MPDAAGEPRLRRTLHGLVNMSLYGWVFVLLTMFLAGLTVYTAGIAVDTLRVQYLDGVPGQVTVRHCEAEERGWSCTGEFVADDGRLRVSDVRILSLQDEQPREPVRTLISGASARVAHQPEPGIAWMVTLLPVVVGWVTYTVGRGTLENVVWDASDREHPPFIEDDPPVHLAPVLDRPSGSRVVPALVIWYVLLVLSIAAVARSTTDLSELLGPPYTMDAVVNRAESGALVLVPGVVLAWAWTWRLGRWVTGALRRPRPAAVEVHVAEAAWAGMPFPFMIGGVLGVVRAPEDPQAYWLRLRDDRGRYWYQRVIHDPRLGVAGADSGVFGFLRPCPGLRRMHVVDIPGIGRLWPASTARARPPRNYDLHAFDPGRIGERHRAGWWAVLGVGALALVIGVVWLLAGPLLAGYTLVVLVSLWFWAGAVPWHGTYANALPPQGHGLRSLPPPPPPPLFR
jgi:hypothetical protein